MIEPKSKCCRVSVRVETGSRDLGGVGCTNYYACTKCGEACDTEPETTPDEKREGWEERFNDIFLKHPEHNSDTVISLTPKYYKDFIRTEIEKARAEERGRCVFLVEKRLFGRDAAFHAGPIPQELNELAQVIRSGKEKP